MIGIRHASIHDKYMTYEWLSLGDTASMHMGGPDYPENPVMDWEQFQASFEDFYYEEDCKSKGAVLIIEKDGIGIGCVCYACFHLNPRCAELDIWLSDSSFCGKGYGTEALNVTIGYLKEELNIDRFIIRPSEKNVRAIHAYEKVGFTSVSDKVSVLQTYLKPEFFNQYGAGDYGYEMTAVLILE